MDTNELTAKYIWEDKERLQMALHVYEAMPTVRKRLIESVFKAVGEHVSEALEGVEVEPLDESVYFHSRETEDFFVFAEVEHGKGTLWLCAGIYVEDKSVDKAKQDKIRERFEAKGDLDTWSNGKFFSSDMYVAYAYAHHKHVVARWDQGDFLSKAILNQDEVVSRVADILVRIYEGVFVSQ